MMPDENMVGKIRLGCVRYDKVELCFCQDKLGQVWVRSIAQISELRQKI